MQNSKDNIGNRARDLPARSAVPQPTAPPHAPVKYLKAQYPTSRILASNKCHKKLVTSIHLQDIHSIYLGILISYIIFFKVEQISIFLSHPVFAPYILDEIFRH